VAASFLLTPDHHGELDSTPLYHDSHAQGCPHRLSERSPRYAARAPSCSKDAMHPVSIEGLRVETIVTGLDTRILRIRPQ
jgi:hypothetical protein